MPEISHLEWLVQLAGIGVLGTAVGAAATYPIFCITHKASLEREERLRLERQASEAAHLTSVGITPISPGPVDVAWSTDDALRPYSSPQTATPAYVVPVSPALTCETVMNPPVHPRPITYKPSRSPLADAFLRHQWEPVVGPAMAQRLTVTDVEHLQIVTDPDSKEDMSSGRRGFQPAVA